MIAPGRVQAEPNLTVPGHPDIFVAGDICSLQQDGAPLPGVAQVAKQQGVHAARNVLRAIRGEPLQPFRYRDYGNMATIGRGSAVADIGPLKMSGFVAWLIWLFIHIFWLIGFRNRLAVLTEWAWAYVTMQRRVRLITGERWPTRDAGERGDVQRSIDRQILAIRMSYNRSAARANVNEYWLWGAPGYLIGDLGVMPTRAYSTRKLRSNHIGSAIRIRRSSDNAEQDIGFSGENLDTAAISTFVGSNSAYVVKWYDQSGTADHATQTTAASQPRIVNAGTIDLKNGKAAIFYTQVMTPRWSLEVPTNVGVDTLGVICGVDPAQNAGPTMTAYCGPVMEVSNGTLYAVAGTSVWTGAVAAYSTDNGSASIVFGGALQNVRATSATSGSGTEHRQIGGAAFSGYSMPGWIGEVVLFNPQLSAPNYAAMYTNQKTYWGTP